MVRRRLFAATTLAVAVSGCSASIDEGAGSDSEEPLPTAYISIGDCLPTGEQAAIRGTDPIVVVESMYPGDLVFFGQGTIAPGYAGVLVARDGRVIADVTLERTGGRWRVACVTEGDFDPEYYPVPE